MAVVVSDHRPFATAAALDAWLRLHHASSSELWVRVFKKDSGTSSVTWNDMVIAALTWGWIDGQRQSLDGVSFVQRLTPRRRRSTWSKKNCEHADRLIAAGLMQPAGLAQVQAARDDGRWDAAYAGSADMVMPDDLLAALADNAAAAAAFAALKRTQLFSIYFAVTSAAKPATRIKRINNLVKKLSEPSSAGE